jgi:hypothetical protein
MQSGFPLSSARMSEAAVQPRPDRRPEPDCSCYIAVPARDRFARNPAP